MEMNLNKKSIITYALIAVAVVFVLLGINGIRLAPLPKVALDEPSYVSCFDGGFVITDSNSTRLLFADDDFRVHKAVGLNVKGSPFDAVYDTAASAERVFITGVTRVASGIYFESEAVAEYSPEGEFIRVLYTEAYGEDDYVSSPNFLDVRAMEDGRVVLMVSRDRTIDFLDIGSDNVELLLSVSAPGKMYGGQIFEDMSAVVWEHVGRYYTIDSTGRAKKDTGFDYAESLGREAGLGRETVFELGLDEYEPFFSFNSAGRNGLLYSTKEGLFRYDYESGEPVSVPALKSSAGLFLFNLAFFASAVYLFVLLIIKAVRLLKNGDNAEKAKSLLIAVVLSAGVSAFYTFQSYNLIRSGYESRLISQNRQLCRIVKNHYQDFVEGTYENGVKEYCSDDENHAVLDELRKDFTEFANSNGKEECFYAGIEIIRNGELNVLLFTDWPSDCGNYECTLEEYEALYGKLDGYKIFETYDSGIDYIACISPLTDCEGKLIGLMTVGFNESHLLAKQRDIGLRMLVSLTVLFIIAYVCFKAFASLKDDITRYKADKLENINTSKLPLFCGFAAFLVTAICQFDSVILVFAAKSLCTGLSDINAAKMAALPISLYSFGIMGGSALPALLSGRMKEKLSSLLFCIVGTVSMALAVYSINISNIYVFTAAKLVEGLAIGGAVYSLIYSAPFNCADAEEQRRLINTTQAAAVSAGVLGIFAGGYIAEYLSYQAIFAVKGALCIILALVCVPMLADSGQKPEDKSVSSRKGAWSFYIRPEVLLLYICCILPMNLFNGYRTYLFPIYSQSAGISTVMLSNIYVIAKAASFFSADSMKSSGSASKPQRTMAVMLMTCSTLFICFVLSPNIWWAIAVLFASNFLLRGANTAGIFCQAELCDDLNYDKKAVSLCSETVKGVFSSVSSPVLSLFLALGNNWACAAAGAAGAVLTSIYSILRRKKEKA